MEAMHCLCILDFDGHERDAQVAAVTSLTPKCRKGLVAKEWEVDGGKGEA